MHYSRVNRHGTIEKLAKIVGRKWIADGYECQYLPNHPLSQRAGHVYTHRIILYERIGSGEHRCSGCGKPVKWEDGSLVAHHIDENKINNDPFNLTPYCHQCNLFHSAMMRQRLRREKFGYCEQASQMMTDTTFYMFTTQWQHKDPAFHLDNPQVREDLMALISAAMSLLAIAPPDVWQEFLGFCAKTAKEIVPLEVQCHIKSAAS